MKTSANIGRLAVLAIAALIAGCGSSSTASPASGGPASGATAVAASILAPPVASLAPALAGTWAIKETLTKDPAPGMWPGPVGKVENRIWAITSTCASGPCDVDVVSTHVGAAASTGIKLHFAYADGSWTNTYSYPNDCTPSSGPAVKAAWTNTVKSTFKIMGSGTSAVLSGSQDVGAVSNADGQKSGCTSFTGVAYDLAGTAAGAEVSPGPSASDSAAMLRLATSVEADAACGHEATLKSQLAANMTKFTLVNRTASTVSVFWLDYKGKREHWLDVISTDEAVQQSYKTHMWVVADETGRCLRLFHAPATITLK